MLLDLFLIGLVVNLEPIPLSAMILLLAADRGVLKGVGFVLGWMLTLVAIVAVTVRGHQRPPTGPGQRSLDGACWRRSWPAAPSSSSSATGAGPACAGRTSWRPARTPAPATQCPNSPSGWPASTASTRVARRRLGLRRPALGPGGRRRVHHRRRQAEQPARILLGLRLLSLVHDQLPDHGDLRRRAAGHGPGQAARLARVDQPRIGTRPSPSSRWCSASTSWPRASPPWSATAEQPGAPSTGAAVARATLRSGAGQPEVHRCSPTRGRC